MKNNAISISSDIKSTILPVIIILVLLGGLFYAGNLGYTKIQEQLSKIQEIKETTSALQTKYDLLATTNTESLDPTNASVIAVPNKNQSVFFLAQVKQLANEYNVQIINVTIRGQGDYKDSIKRGNMKLELEAASLFQLIDFINEMQQVAPLSSVNTLNIDSTQGSVEMVAELFVYWSEFPDTIPALTEPLTVLSREDQELLDTLTSLQVPSFTVLNPSTSQLRVDPFR